MDKILNISNLKKTFHTSEGEVKALDSITFDVKDKEFVSISEGEFLSIIGPSGCGKSTILSILSGLEEKSSGKISFSKNCTIGNKLQNES